MPVMSPQAAARTDALGFTAGAPLRLLAAAGFAVAAFGAVALATGAPPAQVPAPVPTSAAVVTGMLDVTITATYPVTAWTVQGPAGALSPRVADATRWQGTVPCAAAGTVRLFVQADHQDALHAGPVALRVAWAGGAALVWGEGFVAETVTVGGP